LWAELQEEEEAAVHVGHNEKKKEEQPTITTVTKEYDFAGETIT